MFQVQLTSPESLNTRTNIERTFIFICDLQISQQSRPRRRIIKLGYYDLDDIVETSVYHIWYM